LEHDFGDIRAFLQVVESGGISAAATRSNVSKSVLSARVSRLEEALGAKLLHRSPRGVVVTDAGQRFYARMADVASRLQQAVDEVADNNADLSASLRITAPMTFGTIYLGPLLFEFMAQHPQLEITLDLNDRYLDILTGGYDLAVRIGRLADSSLMARALAPSARALCCSPGYAEREGIPQDVAAIQQHQCICYGSASIAPYWQFAAVRAGDPVQQIIVRGRTHLNNGESMRDAAIAGLGLAVLPRFIAAPALADGRLIEVLPTTPPSPDTIHAVYPQTRYVSRAVRALIDMLVARFQAVPPWERGSAAAKVYAS
jgi:DNA-binding transcriptional LysR family regulator